MIIRIMGEGQFDLDDDRVGELNDLDDAVEAALDATTDGFIDALAALLAFVRANAVAVEPTTLVESDVVLPPADATEEEVRAMLTDEGLIPG